MDFAGQTTLHPFGLAAVFALGIALLMLPRRHAILPIMIMACFVSPAQRWVVGPMDMTLLRLMVLFGWVRLVVRGEIRAFSWRVPDALIVLWATVGATAYVLLRLDAASVVNRLGWAFDMAGAYFLFRFLLRDWDDVVVAIRGFVYIGIPVVIAFLVERATGRNPFSVLGGVPFVTPVREGRLRCQGPFPHAIMAGCFWAAVMPMLASLWWRGGADRIKAVAGIGISGLVVVLTASSTPVMAVIFGCIGGATFIIREQMRLLRWSILIMAIALHLVMNNPVWHLIARVNVVGGSTGWHRYHLIDEAVNHFGDWWALGTLSTASWGRGLQDVTNQYVLEGVRGGVVALILFVAIIGFSFRQVGLLWRSVRGDVRRTALAWSLGVAVFVHLTSFVGVSYFGQINLLWYLTLAMISSLGASGLPRERLTVGAQSHAGRHKQQLPTRVMAFQRPKTNQRISGGEPI